MPKNPPGYFIKVIENLAGRQNSENFNSYREEGGLENILERNQIKPEKKHYMMRGTMEIIKAINL